jgi:hypothetical protein
MLGDDVVQRQLLRVQTAVLTQELIPKEDLASRQPNPRAGSLDQVMQPNHRRDAEHDAGRSDDKAIDLQHFRFPTVEQNERTSSVTDVEWFVVLIQDENVGHTASPGCARCGRFGQIVPLAFSGIQFGTLERKAAS